MLKKTFIISCIAIALVITTILTLLPTPLINNKPANARSDNSRSIDEPMLIKNATIFTGDEFIDNTNIEVSNGVITSIDSALNESKLNNSKAISSSRHTIDATGKTLIPGLIDAHTHSFGTSLEAALNFGVTTQVDMFSAPSILKNQINLRNRANQSQQADLFSAGMLATVDGGHGTQFGVPIETLSSPSDATDWVAKRVSEGSDFIKLVYMPYSGRFKSLDRATAAAVIHAAHQRGLIVVAHVSTQQAAQELVEDGIDGLVHIFADQKLSAEFLSLAKRKNIFVIPTLSVIAAISEQQGRDSLAKQFSDNKAIAQYLSKEQSRQLLSSFGNHNPTGFDLATAIHNTEQLHRAGITILAGSDAPNPGTTYGASIHQEMELLVQAGLSPSEALNASSRSVAQLFKLNTKNPSGEPVPRGRLMVGAKADFIILDSSPLNNIKATRKIAAIYKSGKRVTRVSPREEIKNNTITSPLLSDFANGLTVSNKLEWSTTNDSMTNGVSSTLLKIEDNLLKVNAEVKEGFIFPWSGAIVFASNADQNKFDISDYAKLSFKIRGDIGSYRAMTFSGNNPGIPPTQSFKVSDNWQTIELPLDKFNGLDLKNFSGLAIVAGPELGEFVYYLDDVKLIK